MIAENGASFFCCFIKLGDSYTFETDLNFDRTFSTSFFLANTKW